MLNQRLIQTEGLILEKNGYCEICNTIVHKSSIAKHLRSIKHLENQSIIPNNFSNENVCHRVQK